MKGFKLTSTGDVEIKNNQIQMIEGNELLRQTVECVLGTNKGEWFLNPDEGINFQNILGKRTPEQEQPNKALEKYYQSKIADMRADENALAIKLRDRLEGK